MQHPLTLNDIRPRPRIYSGDVIKDAALAFVKDKRFTEFLSAIDIADDEWVARKFVDAAKNWTSHDTWALASELSEALCDTVSDDYVTFADEFESFLSKEQDRILKEWVLSGGTVDPAPKPARIKARVLLDRGLGEIFGISIPDESCSATGKTTFLGDDQLAKVIDSDGRITSLRIIAWEDILEVLPLTANDVEIVERQAKIKAEDRRRSDESSRKYAAERDRAALLKANTPTHEEAVAIFDRLCLGDNNEEAARTANAILMTLMTRLTK